MHLSEFIKPRIDVTFLLLTRCFLALGILFLSACTTTPITENKIEQEPIFNPGQLREDLRFLDKSLQEIHPEPFSRLDRSTYQQIYQQLHQTLIWPLRRQDFYRQMAPLISRFSDTHTRLLYPQQEYQQFISSHGKFPLALVYSNDGLFVVADGQEKIIIPIGAKVIAINDVAIESILENFKSYIPAETGSGQRRMIQMEFPRLLWSLYDVHTNYEIDYLWHDRVFRKTVRAIKTRDGGLHQPVASHYGSYTINKQTRLLWLNDFNEKYDSFEQFLDRQFRQIAEQEISTVILDLRYNKGGITDNLALLLSYLTKDEVSWANKGTVKLSEPFRKHHYRLLTNTKNEKYGQYLDWLPVEYLNLLQWEILFASDGEWLEADIDKVNHNEEIGFKGDLYVLSNGYCFSACASLVATLQQNKLATIIGEAPGSQTHVQYGYPIEVELPNTGLKLVIPAMKFELNDSISKQKVITPDHQLERSVIDIILGQDTVLDFALKLSNSP